jgi:hypothetical protein
MSNGQLLLLLSLGGLLGACATRSDLSAPAPSEAERHPLGCQVRIASKRMVVTGELVGLANGRYVLLHEDELISVDTSLSFTRVTVVLGRVSEHPNRYGWSSILPLVSISHGALAVFTLPMNLITALSLNQGAAKSRYVVELKPVRSDVLCKFARFPQGIPPRFFEGRQWSD